MTRLKRGTSVIVTDPIKRGRRHKHGPAKVRKGAKAQVTHRRSGGLFGKTKYDLEVHDGMRTHQVRSVPESSLMRAPVVHLPRVLVVAVLVLLVLEVIARSLV